MLPFNLVILLWILSRSLWCANKRCVVQITLNIMMPSVMCFHSTPTPVLGITIPFWLGDQSSRSSVVSIPPARVLRQCEQYCNIYCMHLFCEVCMSNTACAYFVAVWIISRARALRQSEKYRVRLFWGSLSNTACAHFAGCAWVILHVRILCQCEQYRVRVFCGSVIINSRQRLITQESANTVRLRA